MKILQSLIITNSYFFTITKEVLKRVQIRTKTSRSTIIKCLTLNKKCIDNGTVILSAFTTTERIIEHSTTERIKEEASTTDILIVAPPIIDPVNTGILIAVISLMALALLLSFCSFHVPNQNQCEQVCETCEVCELREVCYVCEACRACEACER